ncbi:permease [Pectinatus sottacetonis]|uniref:permease n=1 Tax=Pectinatus sottacetonis TaxID=1002795 RepID=UPI0018C4A8C4|nr:permease [Pectinatus sottacetonis]
MLQIIADTVVYNYLGLSVQSTLGQAVNFFVYDSIKIFLMLFIIIFFVSILRSYFPAERTKKLLSHRRQFFGNIAAALLGIVTPFCSCSAVPVFIGFIESGVPLGITFSFLIASPMVNEVAVIMLWGLLGWKIMMVYIISGLVIAIIAGIVIGKLKLERFVQDYVYEMKLGESEIPDQSLKERIYYALEYTKQIIKKIGLYVIIAIALGGFIHGYAPADLLVKYAGKDSIFAVPAAVLIGVPLYSNAAGIIPIISVLIQKGLSLGTALAFMMAVTALSFPEMIILRNVLKKQLLAVFVGILFISIMFTGYLFNFLM